MVIRTPSDHYASMLFINTMISKRTAPLIIFTLNQANFSIIFTRILKMRAYCIKYDQLHQVCTADWDGIKM